jgi:NAD(P)-dependent dehydrogenase (short-subunit alcohol dehydrogenase family)
MNEFEGKVALVTGGGSEIGRATALAFARDGAQVVIGNRSVQRGEETVSMIRVAGGTASFRRTDVMLAADITIASSRLRAPVYPTLFVYDQEYHSQIGPNPHRRTLSPARWPR